MMFYLVMIFLTLLISIAIGMIYLTLNYHIKIELTQKDCVWCGEIDT